MDWSTASNDNVVESFVVTVQKSSIMYKKLASEVFR